MCIGLGEQREPDVEALLLLLLPSMMLNLFLHVRNTQIKN